MRKYLLAIFLVVLSLLLLASCCPTSPIYPLEPRVLVLSPSVGSVFSPGPVTVKAYVENIKLVDKVGQANVPAEGHLIYYLDAHPPVKLGEPATTNAGAYVISGDTMYTWPDLTSGNHVLAVPIVNNDNTPVNAPSAVRVNLTVK